MENLECLFCRSEHPFDVFNPFCPECKEPMLLPFPKEKRAFHLEKELSLEKFLDFLPLKEINHNLTLGEGNTPLLKLNRLMEKFRLPEVFIKNETVNPTSSFKDRGTAVAVQKAVSMGIQRIGTVSTGNMASSTAAYGAKAGLKTFVLLKEDTSPTKVLAAGFHSPFLIKVRGDYGKLFEESFSIGKKHNIYFMNSVDPLRIEGYKLTGYEIFLQLKNKAPGLVFVPVSSGGHLTGLIRSFLDLKQEGWIQNLPTFVGVQARGCSPVARAYASGKLKVKRIRKAETIAHSISNPDPPGGNILLKLMRETNGIMLDVSDREILKAQKTLAGLEGIFCEPASATTLAGLLSGKVKFSSNEQVVLVLTGSGLKTTESIKTQKINLYRASLSSLDKTISALF